MARYTAEQIYAFAREAGFPPDRAATMTAIALAESGGNGSAHNPHGEDSRGLWQINARAHPGLGESNLYDPLENAKAAYAVSHGGADVSPWTTTHGDLSARYLRFRAAAEAAAAAYGDGSGRGMWTGTSGYGDHTSAGDAKGGGQPAPSHSSATTASTAASGSDNVNVAQQAAVTRQASVAHAGEEYGIAADAGTGQVDSLGGGGAPAANPGEEYGIPMDGEQPPPVPAAAPSTVDTMAATMTAPARDGDSQRLQRFLDSAVAQTGDQYVFGAETKLQDPNPSQFDCSELVEWAGHQAGVRLPDGAFNQYSFLNNGGHAIPVEQAVNTPGALLFSFSSDPNTGQPKAAHVAISLGDGKTIEAKGTEYGVGSWEANAKRFQYAAVIPELAGQLGAGPMATTAQAQVDAFSYRLHHDPVNMDNQPSTLAVSQQLTDAQPASGDATPEPEPHDDVHTIGDVDRDGMDDVIEHASDYVSQFHDPGHSGTDHYDHHDAHPS